MKKQLFFLLILVILFGGLYIVFAGPVSAGATKEDIVRRIAEVSKSLGFSQSDAEIVAKVASRESGFTHCSDGTNNCGEENISAVLCGDFGNSCGIFQLNKIAHPEWYNPATAGCDGKTAYDIDCNIRIGVRHLRDLYNLHFNDPPKLYACKNVSYSGWDAVLRYYNGWPSSGCVGDPNYVENVKGQDISAYLGMISSVFGDTTPPTTTIQPPPVPGPAGWFTSPVLISFVGEDNPGGSGVAVTQWNIRDICSDFSGWLPIIPTGPISFSPDTIFQIFYRSIDNAGNIETDNFIEFKIDTTAPVITPPPLEPFYLLGQQATFVFDAVDKAPDPVCGASSGISSVTATLNGVSIQSGAPVLLNTHGLNEMHIEAFDVAGNGAGEFVQFTVYDPVKFTPIGDNVVVQSGSGSTIIYSHVDTIGETTVTTSTTPPDSPSGFLASGLYYDIQTTATFSGPITVALPYDPSLDPSLVRLFHFENGQWVDVTTSVDPVVHTVTGVVNTLSPFVVGTSFTFVGFLQPIDNDGSSIFKLGSTVPTKFRLLDSNGNFITNVDARLFIAKISDGIIGTYTEAVSTNNPDAGNKFRYDMQDNQYIFNLGTKGLSQGTWQLKVVLNGGDSRSVLISLK